MQPGEQELMVNHERYQVLIEQAKNASINAYAPYSGKPCGAALLTTDNQVVTGCNLEFATYSGSICAELSALSKAISAGHRQFQALALVPGDLPCGMCRQYLSEFGLDIDIVLESQDGAIRTVNLADLLPGNFGRSSLPI